MSKSPAHDSEETGPACDLEEMGPTHCKKGSPKKEKEIKNKNPMTIIPLNVKRLNAPVKKLIDTEWQIDQKMESRILQPVKHI